MGANRRNVLLKLGSIAMVGGGAFATEATATVSGSGDTGVSVVADSAAVTLDATNSSAVLVSQQNTDRTTTLDSTSAAVGSLADPPEAGESPVTIPNAFEVFNHGTEELFVKATVPDEAFADGTTAAEKAAVRGGITVEYVDAATDTVYDLLWDGTGTEWVAFGAGEGGWVTVQFESDETGRFADLVDRITFTTAATSR